MKRVHQFDLIQIFGSVVLGICWTEIIGDFLSLDFKSLPHRGRTEFFILISLLLYSIRFVHSYMVVEFSNENNPFLPANVFFLCTEFISKILIMVFLSIISFYWKCNMLLSLSRFLIFFGIIISLGIIWEIIVIFQNRQYPPHHFITAIEIWLFFDITSLVWVIVGVFSQDTKSPKDMSLLQEAIFGTLILVGISDYILNRDIFFEPDKNTETEKH